MLKRTVLAAAFALPLALGACDNSEEVAEEPLAPAEEAEPQPGMQQGMAEDEMGDADVQGEQEALGQQEQGLGEPVPQEDGIVEQAPAEDTGGQRTE